MNILPQSHHKSVNNVTWAWPYLASFPGPNCGGEERAWFHLKGPGFTDHKPKIEQYQLFPMQPRVFVHEQSTNHISLIKQAWMLCKVTHCAGRVSANARPHQLRWGDREMGTAIISCVECSQVAGLIQKVGRDSSKSTVSSCSCPYACTFFFVFHCFRILDQISLHCPCPQLQRNELALNE